MTVTSIETETANASAAAIVRCLPADLIAGAPLEGPGSISQAIAGEGSKAVTASLTGTALGQIIIIMSAELAAQVEAGPFGPQELVAGVETGLVDATAALSSAFGDIRHEVAQSLDAEVALSSADQFESITVVPLSDAGTQVGSVVLLLNLPKSASTDAPSASFETLAAAVPAGGVVRGVELLSDVEMGVTAELGRTRMTVRELLSLQPGSVVELDRAAGSPVDLLANGTLVARGEVVVVDEEFGVRITEIIGYDTKK